MIETASCQVVPPDFAEYTPALKQTKRLGERFDTIVGTAAALACGALVALSWTEWYQFNARGDAQQLEHVTQQLSEAQNVHDEALAELPNPCARVISAYAADFLENRYGTIEAVKNSGLCGEFAPIYAKEAANRLVELKVLRQNQAYELNHQAEAGWYVLGSLVTYLFAGSMAGTGGHDISSVFLRPYLNARLPKRITAQYVDEEARNT